MTSTPPSSATCFTLTTSRWRRLLPGIALAAFGAAIAWVIAWALPVIPWLTASLVLGVVVGCIPAARPHLATRLAPGLSLASKRLLRLGIVLLGLKLSLGDIAELGWVAIIGIVVLVLASFGLTYSVAQLFGLEGDQPILMAAGFSICGVSAIGAVSAARGSDLKDTGTPVAMVTLFGTAAIVALPALAPVFGLDATQFGHWVGASVHDVGQVVATAQTGGTIALASAVVVKLTRVLTLAPMVAGISLVTRRRDAAASEVVNNDVEVDVAAPRSSRPRPPIVPLFIVGFLALVLVRSFLPVPDAVLQAADFVQTVFIAMALFGIGASLRLEKLARSGARAAAAGLTSWLLILALALGFVALIS